MSASPEDPDQGGSPHPVGESSHAGGHPNHHHNGSNGLTNGHFHVEFIANSVEHNEENPTNIGVPHQGGQENQGYNITDSEGAESDVKNAGPRSAIHQTTPASTEDTSAPAGDPGPSPANIASAIAALTQHRSRIRVNGTRRAHSELNKVSSTGTASTSTTDSSPSPPPPLPSSPPHQPPPPPPPPPPPQSSLPVSQHSTTSTGSTSHQPTGPGGSADPAENAGTGGHRNELSLLLRGTAGLILHQGPQMDTEGQTHSDETRGPEDSRNHSLGENEAAAEHGQVPVTSQHNNSLNQQISRGFPSLNGASDWEGGFQPQHHEPAHASSSSTQLDLSHPLRESQLSGPAPAPGPPTAQTPRSSSMNPIAPIFVPRPEHPDIPQSITLPTWQPDAEVTQCPICNVRFGMFLRRHHCRKCGRVVCDGCSPHRITIPHPYIVRPPGDPGPALQFSYPGVERGIADLNSIGGGERVRLCNPCVPDPNTAPPQPQQSSQPIIVDGRASRARPSNRPFGNYSADARPYPQPPPLPPRGYTLSRNRSATTSAGHGQEYMSFIPYTSTSSQYPPPNAAYFSQPPIPHRRVSSSGLMHIDHFGRLHASSSSGFASLSGLNRPLPRTPTPEPEIPEEDICPVCHRELPSRSLSNSEALREAHINNCITSHSNYRGDQVATTTGARNHGTPPPRTTRRTRMFPYVATEKDCVGDVECTICLEEFKVGDQMARLECFCRFHRSCIDSWFVNRPGRCPIHQHDSFGY